MQRKQYVPQRNYKIWPFWMAATLVVLLCILEVWYRNYPFYRHSVDYKMAILDQLTNQQFDSILLSDSVTAVPLRGIHLADNTLDMTTNQAISLAGNYFILQRFLDKNPSPRNIYLFFIPNLFQNDLTSNLTFSYFETVFNRPNEIKIMRSVGRNDLYVNSGDFFEKRLESIKIFKHYRWKYVGLPLKQIIPLEDRETAINFAQLKAQTVDFGRAAPIAEEFLQKILVLCQQAKISITLVLEPLPISVYQKWISSPLAGQINEWIDDKNVGYLDINAIQKFPDSLFPDGMHLAEKWIGTYLYLIDEHITKILPTY